MKAHGSARSRYRVDIKLRYRVDIGMSLINIRLRKFFCLPHAVRRTSLSLWFGRVAAEARRKTLYQQASDPKMDQKNDQIPIKIWPKSGDFWEPGARLGQGPKNGSSDEANSMLSCDGRPAASKVQVRGIA